MDYWILVIRIRKVHPIWIRSVRVFSRQDGWFEKEIKELNFMWLGQLFPPLFCSSLMSSLNNWGTTRPDLFSAINKFLGKFKRNILVIDDWRGFFQLQQQKHVLKKGIIYILCAVQCISLFSKKWKQGKSVVLISKYPTFGGFEKNKLIKETKLSIHPNYINLQKISLFILYTYIIYSSKE